VADGEWMLGTAAFACFDLDVRMSNGKVGAVFGGRHAIDSRTFTSGKRNRFNYFVNRLQFWKAYIEEHPEAISEANKKRIFEDELSPIVDDVWIKAYPEDAQYIGDTLHHHHYDCGAWAIPIPGLDHQRNTKKWHENC